MFWHMSSLSASSPVETILDKEDFSLDELLDEEEIIQECKALNSRLINFLRDRTQVEQLLRYIVEEAPEDAESKRVFKFPFIACEIFTCEIDVILKTLVEEDELLNLLFSFLEPKHSHSTMLAGYFSKVVVCLMLRKTTQLMNYVQAHQDVIRQLVDLIGITSIMEVLVRLVGADDHVYSNFVDVMQWLANSNLLEMIVDKLNPSSPPEVHANAAETLCAITQNAPSALASKLSTPSFIARIFGHALEDSQSKSGLVHSLSVCISLMDPKRLASNSVHSIRNQHFYESPVTVNPETVSAMLPKLGDLLMLLNVSSDERVLPTTYGELRPPLGKHRLKVVEFFAVLLRTGNENAEKELVCVGAIQRILDLFFEYPFHSALHHLVESIITTCLESKNSFIVDHLFKECNLVGKILQTDRHCILSGDSNQPTISTSQRQAPRAGNLGHITRMCNKLVQLGNGNSQIQGYLQENSEWVEWEATVLQKRNAVENVYHWACGRPTALQDRTRDSDEDDLQDRDYDVGALANNLSMAFRYNIYENDDTEEVRGSLERDDEDVYFDDESAEVVISSLRLGDDHESLFTNSNWFSFQDDRINHESLSTSEKMSEINLNGTANVCSSSSDDEVVVGEDDDLVDSTASVNGTSGSTSDEVMNSRAASGGVDFFQSEPANNDQSFGDRPSSDSVGWQATVDTQVGGSDWNSFQENGKPDVGLSAPVDAIGSASISLSNGEVEEANDSSARPMESEDGSVGTDTNCRASVPSLFEEDVEFVGVEPEGTEKAMEQALKEGTVGEAGPLKKNFKPKMSEKKSDEDEGMLEFNDMNYWKVDQEVAVVQQ
ncbi:hypothetical protein AQUCO_03000157v1 [Aquilegia coerulea]|uniref:Uncharacterized protein n=1 Tax=Aquilegia coerulea TaxID=218851 RepID=A0A2G5D1H8_AQUCA|nr:hypothetical protein AQUCO_03000157v1 [Aquilegia coerulea]PIA37369.1 hypothetical protein AQUCO_03000157v1 [Aquilegia coerulea]PIA37371.1 hypothetical protein AQUCO_03000157v1 [Aquilegia coerulea]